MFPLFHSLPLSLLLSLTTLSFSTASPPKTLCKAIPSSPSWPSVAQWSALNASIDGNLVKTVPPGSVCHASSPNFNNASCAYITSQWTNATFHASNPVSVDYNDDTCSPDPSLPCSGAGYPVYVVVAQTAAHVQAGVNFARKHNIRLIVKGTGHDFNGRSHGPNALSIYTHNIRGVEFTSSFHPAGSKSKGKGVSAVTIAAGTQMQELNVGALNANVTIIGGGDPNVGIGGWLIGGGHSPVSSAYGLGADNALEFTVVTADGRVVIANEFQHSDLFWALRGGSGSTWAVLLSATMKTYPQTPLLNLIFAVNTTANSPAFWSALTYFHTQIPRLSEGGLMGYYFGVPDMGSGEPDPSKRGKVIASLSMLNGTPEEVYKLIEPMQKKVENAEWGDNVTMNGLLRPFPSVPAWWLSDFAAASVGSDGRLGSWLLGNTSLLGDEEKLKAGLITAAAAPQALLGHIVAGPGVRNAKPVGGSDAVSPAWRKAYTHLVLPASWTGATGQETKDAILEQLTNVRVKALKDLDPDSGAYLNEGDAGSPTPQHDFWGDNYPRLLAIKKKYDPCGVFYCFPCVGSEMWKLTDQGGLCRV